MGEREGEKHQCVVTSPAPPTGDLAPTQASTLTGNQTSDPLVQRLALNPLSHTRQGSLFRYLYEKKIHWPHVIENVLKCRLL